MSKEYLEAFRDILGILSAVSGCEVDMDSEHIKAVDKALQRLEAIDNSKPSEALKLFEEFKGILLKNIVFLDTDLQRLNAIEQYILKAQEQGKALNELIKNHIEFVVEKDRCYFKIKNSKGNEKSFTSYTMLDFWKEVLKNE